jgi:hypothetical protein
VPIVIVTVLVEEVGRRFVGFVDIGKSELVGELRLLVGGWFLFIYLGFWGKG